MFEVLSATPSFLWVDATVRATEDMSLERYLSRFDRLDRKIIETWRVDIEEGEEFLVRLPRLDRAAVGDQLPPDSVIFQGVFSSNWHAVRTTDPMQRMSRNYATL